MKINTWKNNTPQIKRILKTNFRNAKFRVKTDNYSMGKSINIYTDLIKNVNYSRLRELTAELEENGLTGKKSEEYREIKKDIEFNKEIKNKIETLLSDFYHVDYDKYSGEILSGGNCYLFVNRLI